MIFFTAYFGKIHFFMYVCNLKMSILDLRKLRKNMWMISISGIIM